MLQTGFTEGLVDGMPDKHYHSLHYTSNSFCNDLLSLYPEEAQYNRMNKKESTDAQIFGTAVHFGILQPDLFETEYLIAPCCQAVVKSTGKPCVNPAKVLAKDGQWFCKQHLKDVVLADDQPEFMGKDDHDAVKRIRDKVWADPRAKELLEVCTRREVAGLFIDPITGMKCKMKLDSLADTVGMITDVKTSADLRLFHKSFYDWGYHRQDAFYTFGSNVLHAKGLIPHRIEVFNFIVVDKTPPYVIGVFNVPEDQYELGMQQLRPLMNLAHRCESTGIWPGHGWTWRENKPMMEEIRIPSYGIKEIERQSYLSEL